MIKSQYWLNGKFCLNTNPNTDLKVNQKNKYDTYECDACEVEDESQEHILQCKEISKMQEENCESEIISYEQIMNGTVEENWNIAKSFSKIIKIMDIIRKRKSWKN